MKYCRAGHLLNPQFPSLRFHHGTAESKPNSQTFGLGGKKRLKEVFQGFLAESRSVITDCDLGEALSIGGAHRQTYTSLRPVPPLALPQVHFVPGYSALFRSEFRWLAQREALS